MKPYIEDTLSFIESEELRDYLRGRTDWLDRRSCAEIVSYAPAALERKIPTLELIAAQTKPDPEWDSNDPAKFAMEHRLALKERYDNPPGTIFWLRHWRCEEEEHDYGTEFFTEFDAAIRYIREQQKEYDADDQSYLSHSIEKHIPGENGTMAEQCTWVLSVSGDLWYFDYGHQTQPKGWDDIWDYCGNSLNLPVPFQPGDILLADCRPFSKERRVVVLETGDNRDCCSLFCICMLPDGKMKLGAFQHNYFHPWHENSHISGLYRARRWHDELPENEAPLAILSTAIKSNPSLGQDIGNWVLSNMVAHRDADDDVPDAILKYVQER